jgi:hypothetical protein
MRQKLHRLWLMYLAWFPTPLPIGMQEFEHWSQSILAMVPQLPNNDSMRFVLAAMIQRLDPARNLVPKRYFVKALLRAAAGEVAHNIMFEAKERQKAQQQSQETATSKLQVVGTKASDILNS